MDEEFKGACPMCNEIYYDQVELETHASECLGSDKPIEISDDEENEEPMEASYPLSGLESINHSELAQHVATGAPASSEPKACPLCLRMFSDDDELHLHAASCNGTEPPPQHHVLNLRQRQALQRKRAHNKPTETDQLLNQAIRLYKYSKSLE